MLILLSIALLSIVFGATSGEPQSPFNARIIGGTMTTISRFPWQVSLQEYSKHKCGGSIYSQDIIITAAHCLRYVSIKALRIRAGSSFWNSGGVIREVLNVQIHERHSPLTNIYDIGVVRLKTPLKFSSTIQPIALATVPPRNGAAALISGWGSTQLNSNTISNALTFTNVNVIDSKTCRGPTYGYGYKIHSTMICAASPGKDACQSDSGGPMVSDRVLVGVISWGEQCARNNYPGVYSNVAVLKKWIEEVTRNLTFNQLRIKRL